VCNVVNVQECESDDKFKRFKHWRLMLDCMLCICKQKVCADIQTLSADIRTVVHQRDEPHASLSRQCMLHSHWTQVGAAKSIFYDRVAIRKRQLGLRTRVETRVGC
jgi:hypothetical protein